MRRHVDSYARAHNYQQPTASLTLSALTNSVYELSEVWQMTNTMSHYCFQLHQKIEKDEVARKKLIRDHEAAIKKIATLEEYKIKNNTKL